MILPRFLTALVGIPLFLGAVYFGGLPFLFLVLGIVWLGIREFYDMAAQTGYPCFDVLGQIAAVLMVLSFYLNGSSLGATLDHQGTPALVTLIIIAIVLRSLMKSPKDTSISEWAVTFAGIFFVAWSLSHLMLLRDLRPQGQLAVFFLIAIIWASDTMAYAFGKRWGRKKLAESISPKKTWEGAIAGTMAAVGIGVVFQVFIFRGSMLLPEAILLAFATSVIAIISDLGESVLKRAAGVKDSSALLPGHGGILDRFDSFLLAAPFFYYYWSIFKS